VASNGDLILSRDGSLVVDEDGNFYEYNGIVQFEYNNITFEFDFAEACCAPNCLDQYYILNVELCEQNQEILVEREAAYFGMMPLRPYTVDGEPNANLHEATYAGQTSCNTIFNIYALLTFARVGHSSVFPLSVTSTSTVTSTSASISASTVSGYAVTSTSTSGLIYRQENYGSMNSTALFASTSTVDGYTVASTSFSTTTKTETFTSVTSSYQELLIDSLYIDADLYGDNVVGGATCQIWPGDFCTWMVILTADVRGYLSSVEEGSPGDSIGAYAIYLLEDDGSPVSSSSASTGTSTSTETSTSTISGSTVTVTSTSGVEYRRLNPNNTNSTSTSTHSLTFSPYTFTSTATSTTTNTFSVSGPPSCGKTPPGTYQLWCKGIVNADYAEAPVPPTNDTAGLPFGFQDLYVTLFGGTFSSTSISASTSYSTTDSTATSTSATTFTSTFTYAGGSSTSTSLSSSTTSYCSTSASTIAETLYSSYTGATTYTSVSILNAIESENGPGWDEGLDSLNPSGFGAIAESLIAMMAINDFLAGLPSTLTVTDGGGVFYNNASSLTTSSVSSTSCDGCNDCCTGYIVNLMTGFAWPTAFTGDGSYTAFSSTSISPFTVTSTSYSTAFSTRTYSQTIYITSTSLPSTSTFTNFSTSVYQVPYRLENPSDSFSSSTSTFTFTSISTGSTVTSTTTSTQVLFSTSASTTTEKSYSYSTDSFVFVSSSYIAPTVRSSSVINVLAGVTILNEVSGGEYTDLQLCYWDSTGCSGPATSSSGYFDGTGVLIKSCSRWYILVGGGVTGTYGVQYLFTAEDGGGCPPGSGWTFLMSWFGDEAQYVFDGSYPISDFIVGSSTSTAIFTSSATAYATFWSSSTSTSTSTTSSATTIASSTTFTYTTSGSSFTHTFVSTSLSTSATTSSSTITSTSTETSTSTSSSYWSPGTITATSATTTWSSPQDTGASINLTCTDYCFGSSPSSTSSTSSTTTSSTSSTTSSGTSSTSSSSTGSSSCIEYTCVSGDPCLIIDTSAFVGRGSPCDVVLVYWQGYCTYQGSCDYTDDDDNSHTISATVTGGNPSEFTLTIQIDGTTVWEGCLFDNLPSYNTNTGAGQFQVTGPEPTTTPPIINTIECEVCTTCAVCTTYPPTMGGVSLPSTYEVTFTLTPCVGTQTVTVTNSSSSPCTWVGTVNVGGAIATVTLSLGNPNDNFNTCQFNVSVQLSGGVYGCFDGVVSYGTIDSGAYCPDPTEYYYADNGTNNSVYELSLYDVSVAA
jgi:trimeric autotransporter adhesin